MKRKILSILISVFAFLTMTCFAAQAKEVTVMINGQLLQCDVQPQIVEDRTMIPVRAIFEALNYSVDYDSDSQIITATGSGEKIRMQIGQKKLLKMISDENYILSSDVAPMIINSRTFVPLRAVAKILGCDVDWDPDNYTVAIATVKSVNIVNTSDLNGANNYEADGVVYDGNSYYYFTVGNDRKMTLFKETNGTATALCNPGKYPRGLLEYGNYLYFLNEKRLYRISKNGGEKEQLSKDIIDICHDKNMLYFSKSDGIYTIGFGKINAADFELKAERIVGRNGDFTSGSYYSNASERLLVKNGYIYYPTYKELKKMNIENGDTIHISDPHDLNGTVNINVLDDYVYFNDHGEKIVCSENNKNGKTKILMRGSLGIWKACSYIGANVYKDNIYFLAKEKGSIESVTLVKAALDGSGYEEMATITGSVISKVAVAGDYVFIYNTKNLMSIANMEFYRVNLKTGECRNTFLPDIVN